MTVFDFCTDIQSLVNAECIKKLVSFCCEVQQSTAGSVLFSSPLPGSYLPPCGSDLPTRTRSHCCYLKRAAGFPASAASSIASIRSLSCRCSDLAALLRTDTSAPSNRRHHVRSPRDSSLGASSSAAADRGPAELPPLTRSIHNVTDRPRGGQPQTRRADRAPPGRARHRARARVDAVRCGVRVL